MKSKTVFISRSVFSNSPLRVNANYELIGKSLIKFDEITVDTFPKADWYFFYSRNGVYFGLRQLLDRSILDSIKIGTMGKGTAKQYEDMQDRVPEFIGSGDADHVSREFLKVAQSEKVVYVRAKNSLKSIQENIGEKVEGTDLVTYNNYINGEVVIPSADIAVFTSPMNVDGYFQNKKVDTARILIALGKSTKKAISQYEDAEVLMPAEPTEASLKVLIDSILQS